jgi:hypothetical protein
MRHGSIIVKIVDAVKCGRLCEPFSPDDVKEAIGIPFAGVFLPKHRVGNPGNNTQLFIRISNRPVLYRLNSEYLSRL